MDWQIIIGLVTLVLVIFTIVWGTGLWTRREKVKISVTKPSYSANDSDRVLRVFWSCELQRSGEKEIRYITQIQLKPDKQVYNELRQYFNLPEDGVIRITNRLELARGKIVSTGHGVDKGVYPEYKAFIETKDIEKWKIARQLASELEQKVFEVGLVWEDGGKTKWKKMDQKDKG